MLSAAAAAASAGCSRLPSLIVPEVGRWPSIGANLIDQTNQLLVRPCRTVHNVELDSHVNYVQVQVYFRRDTEQISDLSWVSWRHGTQFLDSVGNACPDRPVQYI